MAYLLGLSISPIIADLVLQNIGENRLKFTVEKEGEKQKKNEINFLNFLVEIIFENHILKILLK